VLRLIGLAVCLTLPWIPNVSAGEEVAAVSSEDESADPAETPPGAAPPRRWNAVESRWINGLLFGGMALDTVRYSQNPASQQELGDLTEFEVPVIRVMRLGLAGTFNFKRPWRWLVSGAYRGFDQGFDRSEDASWSLFDLWVEAPIGNIGWLTVGKFKEPLSMERLMGGGFMPGIERTMGTDALTPSRNVGLQIGNHFANARMTWTAGVFNDWAFTGESFDRAASQVIGRLTGLPMNRPEGPGLLHLGVSGRYSDVKPGVLRFKTTPEVFSFPTVLDTGEFPADSMTHSLFEAYYQKGPLWLGGELLFTQIDSPEYGDPVFRSAWIQASWILNGDSRPYFPQRGVFGVLSPKRSVSSGGRGLFEVGARYSTLDLEDGAVRGGESSRLTGFLNWYLTGRSLLAFNYGLIRLDVDDEESYTQAFQLRLFLLF
jgi:phosphate-selective porin OprO/OprP